MLALVLWQVTTPAAGDESLENRACRSVHLWYPAADGKTFYNEITVDQSAAGTYFMVCGWNAGYFGIQELGRGGKKLVLFSVWDSASNDPNEQDPEKRVKVLHEDPEVRIKRFGGEGSGGQCFFDYEWQIGKTYRLMVKAEPEGDRTAYSGYFYLPEKEEWKHLVTFSTITGGKPLGGYYSFVEDFRRNGESAKQTRRAHFGNGWVLDRDDQWQPLLRSKFTADRNPVTNIDAGVDGDRYFLVTGGDVKNEHTPLGQSMSLPETAKGTHP
jgi:hypothetical protein